MKLFTYLKLKRRKGGCSLKICIIVIICFLYSTHDYNGTISKHLDSPFYRQLAKLRVLELGALHGMGCLTLGAQQVHINGGGGLRCAWGEHSLR